EKLRPDHVLLVDQQDDGNEAKNIDITNVGRSPSFAVPTAAGGGGGVVASPSSLGVLDGLADLLQCKPRPPKSKMGRSASSPSASSENGGENDSTASTGPAGGRGPVQSQSDFRLTDETGRSFGKDLKILVSHRSEFQEIRIVETRVLLQAAEDDVSGEDDRERQYFYPAASAAPSSSANTLSLQTERRLYLDRFLQSSTRWEHLYHEALVQPAMLTFYLREKRPPRTVLIYGGGEGATLREVLKWREVERVVMIDLDRDVVEMSKKYLPSMHRNAFEDSRAEVVFADVFEWLRREKVNSSDFPPTQDDRRGGAQARDGNATAAAAEQHQSSSDSTFELVVYDLVDPDAGLFSEQMLAELVDLTFTKHLDPERGMFASQMGDAPSWEQVLRTMERDEEGRGREEKAPLLQ
ncbi:unnamed protein product, partial [Amoebophrya sp. A120]